MNCRGFCVLAFVAALVPAGACQRTRSADSAISPAKPALTFNKDIAPILFERCATCHRPVDPEDSVAGTDPKCFAGAPFPLLEYRDVRAHAQQIVEATQTRIMPPWLPERSDTAFANERRLRDDQIAMIQRWVEAGSLEGDAADRSPVPKWPEGWQLGQPDLVLSLPEPYALQAVGSDVFRNFVIPVPAGATRYVRGIEFRAGNPRSLHHASVGVDRFRISRKIDRSDPGPGFAAMPDDRVQSVFGWSPGKVPFMEPADRAWSLEKGSDLVVQLHMLPTGAPELVQPSVGLFFRPRRRHMSRSRSNFESKSIDIPAGQPTTRSTTTTCCRPTSTLLSIYPHAHYLAKTMQEWPRFPRQRSV